MRRHPFVCLSLFALAALAHAATPAPDQSDEIAALRAEVAELRAMVETLQASIAPQSPPGQAAVTTVEPPPPAPAPPPVAAASPTSNYFNPSISMIGNFLAVGGHNPIENRPAADLRESELGLSAVVDPYARGDFFLSYGEEGVEVEEGFISFNRLPWDLLSKVGRMRASFGTINTLHLHTLPWPDSPISTVNLLGGEEGWVSTGVSVAKIIPLPADVFSELTVQVFRGDSEGLFTTSDRSDLAYNGHYRVFKDLSDATNLDLGLSYGQGPNGVEPNSQTRLTGLNGTLRWKPLRTAQYLAVTTRGEWIRSRREQLGGTETADGGFLSAEYQFARRWSAGARIEASDRADDASLDDDGQALLLTFSPSEFSQLRGELRRRDYAEGTTAYEFLMQLQFAIGAHGAHPF